MGLVIAVMNACKVLTFNSSSFVLSLGSLTAVDFFIEESFLAQG